MHPFLLAVLLCLYANVYAAAPANPGPRPLFLVNQLDSGPLKTKLQQCANGPFYRTDFAIGHRGAALQFPEHTRESYQAAAHMGAGIIECDVTFTKDKQLVCRHAQCDLHTTTNILAKPKLASKCRTPFTPYDAATDTPASAECCSSDISLAEFKTLCGKMDAANPKASNVSEYLQGTANWRTDLYASCGTLMTHAESIDLIDSLGAKFTPELKTPSVKMPFDGFSQADFARKMLAEYTAAGIAPARVWPQSFNREDLALWLTQAPEFAKQAILLDDEVDDRENFKPSVDYFKSLKARGINIIAPPIWALLALDDKNALIASTYARNARAAGLDIITWSLERSGPLKNGGGWYYQSVRKGITGDGDELRALDVLAQDVGVIGVFSDWPATVTYYANCMGIR